MIFYKTTLVKLIAVLAISASITVAPGLNNAEAQVLKAPWHNIERSLRYKPNGTDFVIHNGTRRFNRAIYGTNTAFRVEAGDLPQFALYLPGMGGTLKLGLVKGKQSKWFINAKNIEARYRPGSMQYTIHDPILAKGLITIQVLAGANSESLLLKVNVKNAPGVQLLWAYGGATGKKFSRDGDIGADPESSFYLKPEYCQNNSYQFNGTTFMLNFNTKAATEAARYENEQSPGKKNETENSKDLISGLFPPASMVKQASADSQSSPLSLYNSVADGRPVVCGLVKNTQKPLYWMIGSGRLKVNYARIPALLNDAETARQKLVSRVELTTPDTYINTLGGSLAIAADAIWETPSYLHGAVAWRMRLPAWRGAYAADQLGWHDRAWQHFSSYSASQIISPESGPIVADTALHLARQLEKLGTSMFSSGYISRNPNGDIRPHHYDMNLVFIDQLLTHFYWTGNTDEIKKLWPTIKRHLAWEKRNYDHDGDGLYDAYCCIWASDALQYSGGGVTHSSAYNYRANRIAAQLATLTGDDPQPYQLEADKIKQAVTRNLWLQQNGTYAEFKDLLGNRLLHKAPGLWTIYHAVDEGLPDAMQAYECLQYIDNFIPHIPVQAQGLTGNYYVLSTTNWQPYTWSLNNVAMAENMHTALAYWQGGRNEKAFILWKSTLLSSMYLGASPGNFEQLSFYDAARGELYRDFADPIGITARTLVEGLFGIKPDILHKTLNIKPGLPASWNYATLHLPDISFDFKRSAGTDIYTITPALPCPVALTLQLNARSAQIKQITVNGKPAKWSCLPDAVGKPVIQIEAGLQKKYIINVKWGDRVIVDPVTNQDCVTGNTYEQNFGKATITSIADPQGVLNKHLFSGSHLNWNVKQVRGKHTVFIKLKQGALTWWQPLNLNIHAGAVEIRFAANQPADQLNFSVYNFSAKGPVDMQVNPELKNHYQQTISLAQNQLSGLITVPKQYLVPGSNHVCLQYEGRTLDTCIINWNINNARNMPMQQVDMSNYFNDDVTHIFTNQYLSPRPQSVTLQLPVQGIGNWCYPLTTANIDDSGLRSAAGSNNRFELLQDITFSTPGNAGKNIAFTSQWDNYPASINIPLNGSAAHAYLLMAGSTNAMQSRLINAAVTITYNDGTRQILELKNPENWWPIEQDYDNDGFAFNTNAAKPLRVHLKTGKALLNYNNYISIKGFSNRAIDGGAATVLDVCLNPNKKLKSLELTTIANDVVAGLMAITLVRTE